MINKSIVIFLTKDTNLIHPKRIKPGKCRIKCNKNELTKIAECSFFLNPKNEYSTDLSG